VGLDPDGTMQRWAAEFAGDFYPTELIGMPREQFFEQIDAHGASFWRELPAYPWFPALHQALSKLGHVVFLTAPTGFPDCLAGKYQWLCDYFGEGYTDCIFTGHKDRLAHPRAILIDDSDSNIALFNRRGGQGLTFPQMWNLAGYADNPAELIIQQVTRIVSPPPR
tara:strand:- start:851 stop:1348 length:498 start_codon:yes stop_codon:yes gene_type:complete